MCLASSRFGGRGWDIKVVAGFVHTVYKNSILYAIVLYGLGVRDPEQQLTFAYGDRGLNAKRDSGTKLQEKKDWLFVQLDDRCSASLVEVGQPRSNLIIVRGLCGR